MKLLEALATGVEGASQGTATIYKRGTTTPATLYTAIDGSGATTPASTIALDVNGGAVWYVNEPVDVTVYNSANTAIRSFTSVESGADVEIMSQSFTGTDYNTGATGTSKPIFLTTLLDKWKTSAGTTDWNVLVNNVSTTLQVALGSVSGIFYNVKSSSYGAVGDGSTNDTSAIQAAITDADVHGGGVVYFPFGTYRITSHLSVPSDVQLLGGGPNVSVITIDHATDDALRFTLSGSDAVIVRGLRVQAAQANSGTLLVNNSGASLAVLDCSIGNSNVNGKCISNDSNSSQLVVMNCLITHAGSASYGIFTDGFTGKVRVIGCKIVSPSALNADMVHVNGAALICVGNLFDCSGTSSGTGRCVIAATSGGYTIAGNQFIAPTGGAIQPIVASGTAGGCFVGLNARAQSAFWSVQPAAQVAASNATHEGSEEYDRNGRRYATSDNSASIFINGTIYGVGEVRRTSNAAFTLDAGTPSGVGQWLTIVINNDQGGASGAVTMSAVFKGLASGFTVGANNVQALVFRSYENMAAGGGSSTKYWGFVNSTGNVTP